MEKDTYKVGHSGRYPWGYRKAGNYAVKSGEKYRKYLNTKDTIKKKSEQIAKKSITTKYDKNTNEYIHKINIDKIIKGQKKIDKYVQKGNKYLNSSNAYKQKANAIINKHNIKNGKQYIKKMFDFGTSDALANTRKVTYIGGPIAGVAAGLITTNKKYK